MSNYSPAFEFYAGETKKLSIQINVHKTDADSKEPLKIESPLVAAIKVIQDLTYTALQALGNTGNLVKIEYITGATAGSEIVTVSGRTISVKIQSGVSTATQIRTAVLASADAMALLASVVVSGTGSNTQIAASAVAFTGGSGDQVSIEVPSSGETNLVFFQTGAGPLVVIEDAAVGKISVVVTDVETNLMIDGGVIVKITSAGQMKQAVGVAKIRRIPLPNC
jgi:hypothetical protein